MQQCNKLPTECRKEHTAAGRAAPPLCQELMLRLKIVINTIIRKIRLCLDLNLLFQRRRHRSRSRDRLSGTEKKKVGKKWLHAHSIFISSLSLSLCPFTRTHGYKEYKQKYPQNTHTYSHNVHAAHTCRCT